MTRASVRSRNRTLALTSHGGSGVKKRTKTVMTRTVRLSRTRSAKIVPRAALMLRGLFFVMR